jgi:hypothetical protein
MEKQDMINILDTFNLVEKAILPVLVTCAVTGAVTKSEARVLRSHIEHLHMMLDLIANDN